jgi:hypothetical protein
MCFVLMPADLRTIRKLLDASLTAQRCQTGPKETGGSHAALAKS